MGQGVRRFVRRAMRCWNTPDSGGTDARMGKFSGMGSLTLAALFAVYYFNLDMRLMRSVIVPFLDKHYDSVKREHLI